MAISPKVAKSPLYPTLACEATAHSHEAAAQGLRLHAAGPWTGGDGTAARQRLRLRLRPLQPSPRTPSMPNRAVAASPSSRKVSAACSACAKVPPLAAVVRADSRWVPCART